MWIDKLLDPLCYLDFWPHPWHWISKVNFSNSLISGIGIGGPIDMKRNWCESDTMLGPLYDLELWHQPWLDIEVKHKIVVFYEWMSRSIWNKGIRINRMMVTLCDLAHYIDLGYSGLRFEKNCIWGITSDIYLSTWHFLIIGRHSPMWR